MRVVFLEPGKEAYVDEIDSSLEAMEEAVGGFIEPCYGFTKDEGLCIIGSEDAKKRDDWKITRVLCDDDGAIYDIVAGRAFVCAMDDDGKFSGLNDDQIETVMSYYRYPETLHIMPSGILIRTHLESEMGPEFEMEEMELD